MRIRTWLTSDTRCRCRNGYPGASPRVPRLRTCHSIDKRCLGAPNIFGRHKGPRISRDTAPVSGRVSNRGNRSQANPMLSRLSYYPAMCPRDNVTQRQLPCWVRPMIMDASQCDHNVVLRAGAPEPGGVRSSPKMPVTSSGTLDSALKLISPPVLYL